jgi:peptidoglycan/LPS O-acetylase OafA/YrhL
MMDYNPRLDALRALCVIGVMCFHWQGILQFGWIGVQTFFVLSGFLMTGILAQVCVGFRKNFLGEGFLC